MKFYAVFAFSDPSTCNDYINDATFCSIFNSDHFCDMEATHFSDEVVFPFQLHIMLTKFFEYNKKQEHYTSIKQNQNNNLQLHVLLTIILDK